MIFQLYIFYMGEKDMKKKIVGIFLCMMLITTVIPVTGLVSETRIKEFIESQIGSDLQESKFYSDILNLFD